MATSPRSRPAGRRVCRPPPCRLGSGGRARNSRRPQPRAPPPAPTPIPWTLSRVLPSRAALPASARALLHERARLRDLRPDRIGVLRERDGGGVMRARLLGVARLVRGGRGAELGA